MTSRIILRKIKTTRQKLAICSANSDFTFIILHFNVNSSTCRCRCCIIKLLYKIFDATVSDPTKATITASEGAVNGIQTLKINKLAKAGYLTGATVSMKRKGDSTQAFSGHSSNLSLFALLPEASAVLLPLYPFLNTYQSFSINLTLYRHAVQYAIDR